MGACFEAAELGVPAIAFSQRHAGRGERVLWACAEGLTAHLLPHLFDALCSPRRVLNVNFPALADGQAVAGVEVTHSGWRVGPTSIEEGPPVRGRRVFHIYTLREDEPNEPDCDLDLVRRGLRHGDTARPGPDPARGHRRHADEPVRRGAPGGGGGMNPGSTNCY